MSSPAGLPAAWLPARSGRNPARWARAVGAPVGVHRPIGTTTVTDPGLVNGTTYTYRIWAYRGSWVSPSVTTTLTPNC